jgi:hypothetical protein
MQTYPKTMYKFWYVGNQLRENPSLRCNKIDICIDQVRSGNNKVYADVIKKFIKTVSPLFMIFLLLADCSIFGEHHERRPPKEWEMRSFSNS